MTSKSSDKISAALKRKLNDTPAGTPIEVVVQLHPPVVATAGTRAERIRATKTTFDQDVERLSTQITPDAGKLLETAWINSTARWLATPEQIDELQAADSVQAIDSVGQITAD